MQKGNEKPPRLGIFILFAAIFTAAGCAIIYELLIGSTSSLFLGGSVEQFSLTIGFFLFAMGIGSWASRWIEGNLIIRFIQVEIALALVGGSTVSILYALYAYTGYFQYGMILLILAIGTLIGLEIPILTRILGQYDSLKSALSNALSLDYCGSLIAALIFPYVLLPFLGTMHTSVITGLINWGVGLIVVIVYRKELSRVELRRMYSQVGSVGLLLLSLLFFAQPLVALWENAMYDDPIVYQEQSPYQSIVLTKRGEHVRLFLNGHLQFASVDEYRYHEALVHPALALADTRTRVLIIGGGDGLTAREVLKYPEVSEVDLVDLDPAVTRMATRNPYLTALNDNALSRPEVQVYNEDGFSFLQEERPPYGVIIFDLPDPREEGLAKLYSREGYRLARRLLAPGGVIVTQATSPYYARRAFWCIGNTMEAAGFIPISYHLNIPSFGEWGFQLGLQSERDLTVNFEGPLRYLDPFVWQAMRVFDMSMGPIETEINQLDQPVLARYYREDWSLWF